jgi:hypothetical protein
VAPDCVSLQPQSNRSRRATIVLTDLSPSRETSHAEKENSSSQPLDQGRHPTTQSLFEGKDACGGSRESDEANRGGGPAKGEDDRNWSRSSPLRTATHDDSPKSGGPLDAPVYPGGLRFARPAIKAVKDAVLTLATRPEQIENMLHPTREVNFTRVAAVRPRVSARPGPADRRPAPARLDGVSFRSPRGGLSASRRGAAAWRIA